MIKVITIKSPTPPVGQESLRWIDTSSVPYKEYDWVADGWVLVNDYKTAANKPKIEGVLLTEDTSLDDIGAQAKLEQSFLKDPLGIMPFKWVYNPLTESLDVIDFSQFVPESTITYKGIGYNQTYDWKQDLELPELVDSSKLVFESSDESVATVTDGVIKVISDFSVDGYKSCDITAYLDYGAANPKTVVLKVYNINIEDTIAFEIDVATLGNFKMAFSGGRAWLDTTELTSGVAVPNVVGKHVVIIEDRVDSITIASNRLQGVLNTGEYTGGLFSGAGANHMLTQIIAPKAIFIDRSQYSNTTPNNTLTSLIAPVATDINISLHKALTELYAPNADDAIRVFSCTALEDITCPAVYNIIEGQATAFTAATIAKLLRQSVESGWTEHNVPNGGGLVLKLQQESTTTVGTNAPYSEWSQQAKDDLEILLQRGWIVSYTE